MPVAALLWFLAVPGATVVEIERELPVSVHGVPPSFQLDGVEPERVRVVLSGRRRKVLFMGPDALGVRVDAALVEFGRRSFALTPDNVRHPDGVEVRSIQPSSVKISLSERKDDAGLFSERKTDTK